MKTVSFFWWSHFQHDVVFTKSTFQITFLFWDRSAIFFLRRSICQISFLLYSIYRITLLFRVPTCRLANVFFVPLFTCKKYLFYSVLIPLTLVRYKSFLTPSGHEAIFDLCITESTFKIMTRRSHSEKWRETGTN